MERAVDRLGVPDQDGCASTVPVSDVHDGPAGAHYQLGPTLVALLERPEHTSARDRVIGLQAGGRKPVGIGRHVPGTQTAVLFQVGAHTAGHVSYLLDRAGGVLFAGDAAGGGRGGKVRRPPRMFTDDMASAATSVARLAEPEFEVAVFGHGRAVTGRAVDRFRECAAR
jgi:glyoxylase-like metal-dependent hydrolase (beta-lactamase superfamily II)